MEKTGKKGKRTSKHARAVPSMPNDEKDVCFVIMPFGGWLDDYYETIYSPAIEAAGLEPHRADDLYRPSTIVNDIWAYTRRAKLLLADLTNKNPNVFYELGLAHALAKPAILVAESMEDIPFDLRALRIIVYNKNHPRWGERLQEKVSGAIGEVLKAPQEAVLPAFLHVRETDGTASVTQRQKELIEIKQDLELLRREVRLRPRLRDEGPLEPDEARERITRYVRQGMPESMIVRRLEPLGPPPEWIKDQIKMARNLRPRVVPNETTINPIAPEVVAADPKTTIGT